MPQPPPAPLPSSRRPLPLRARPDLECSQADYQGETYSIVKDPVSLEYFRLRAEQYRILELLDGRRSLAQIRDALQREFPALRPALTEIQQLVNDLYAKGLLYSDRPEQGNRLLERRRERTRKAFFAAIRNVLYIRLPGWDPEPVLRRLYPLCRWMFRPAAVVAGLLLVLSAWTMLLVHFAEFERRLPQFEQLVAWPNLLYVWTIVGAAKLLHELAHGLACKHFGGECHEIGVAFLVLSPCLYCDVSDSWTLPGKWKRIAIAAAGMALEVALSAGALFVWWNTQPGLLNHLCLNLFFVTTLTTIIFNANPLLKYDGYYILGDLVEVPNLRAKADAFLKQTFARWCLGIRLPDAPFSPHKARLLFAVYSLASAVYRWVVLFGIVFFLYHVLKPYGLQAAGVALGVFSAVSIVLGLLWQIGRLVATHGGGSMSCARMFVSMALFCGIAFAGFAIRLPVHRESSFVVEADGVQHVYVTTPGLLEEVHVKPGERVTRGQPLARLANFSRQNRYETLKTTRDVQRIELTIQTAVDDPGQKALAAETLQAINEQLSDYEGQLLALTLTAPCDGVVVAPPLTGMRSSPTGRRAPGKWSGTPLDDGNRGCFLDAGTHLLSVAPQAGFQAVLLVEQEQRADFAPGQPLDVKFEHLPGETCRGRIVQFSKRHVEVCPPALSHRYGGPLPTTTDPEGREILASLAYEGVLAFDDPVQTLLPGMRGRARVLVDSRTAADWFRRYLRTTFHFHL